MHNFRGVAMSIRTRDVHSWATFDMSFLPQIGLIKIPYHIRKARKVVCIYDHAILKYVEPSRCHDSQRKRLRDMVSQAPANTPQRASNRSPKVPL